MAIIFTPDYFKTEFRNGKSIRQIAKENYVSSSHVSHIVIALEKSGKLKKIDRCVVPTNLLTDLALGRRSFYEVEKITGKSYRYLKRYSKMVKWKWACNTGVARPFFLFAMCYYIVKNIVITNYILRVIMDYTIFELYCFNYQNWVIKKIQYILNRF